MGSGGVDKTDDGLWHTQMFGRLRVRCLLPAAPVVVERFQTQKTALLWALLVGQYAGNDARTPLYRDDLAARLWPDAAPQAGRDRLSQALSWLRRNFEAGVGLSGGQVIRADRRAVGLAAGVVTSDAAQMDALLKAERAGDKSDLKRSALLLRQAIALYEGPLLPGVAEEDDLLLLERQRFEAVLQSAARRMVVVSAEMGEGAQAIEYARRLLRMDPANDSDCALLMRLLFRTGDSNAALRAYADFAARRAPGQQRAARCADAPGERNQRAVRADRRALRSFSAGAAWRCAGPCHASHFHLPAAAADPVILDANRNWTY